MVATNGVRHDEPVSPQTTFATGDFPESVTVGDFNGDGKADLAVANGGTNGGANAVSVLLGDALESNGNTTRDFGNGDTLTLDGVAQASIIADDFIGIASVRSDFNADAMSDLLWQNDSGAVSIWEMNGANVLAQSTLSVNPGAHWHVIGPHNGLTT